MATLHVRGVPDDLYAQLQMIAEIHQRSLSSQVITLLNQSVLAELRQQRQADLLATIHQQRVTLPAGTPDSVELLREDRER